MSDISDVPSATVTGTPDVLKQTDTGWTPFFQVGSNLSSNFDGTAYASQTPTPQATAPAATGWFLTGTALAPEPDSTASDTASPADTEQALQKQADPDIPSTSEEKPELHAPAPVNGPVDNIFQGVDVSKLPAGMRNNNPGNLKYSAARWQGEVGPSQNTDQGDPQVVFNDSLMGMRAAAVLANHKFHQGMTTVRQLIAGPGGWTPGYTPGAEGVAKASGLGIDTPVNLSDPTVMAHFLRGVVTQEHGPSSHLYSDPLIQQAVSLAGL